MIPIRKTLNEIISEVKTETVYLLLSSGLDSQSLLFSSLEIGKKVVVVSFTREDHDSRDFKKAKSMASHLGLEFLPVYLPHSLEDIKKYSLVLADKYKCKTKSEFECTFPMIFTYSKIKEHLNCKKGTIVSGLGADCYYVLSKKGILHFKDDPDTFRLNTYSKENYCQKRQHQILKKEHDIEHLIPYLDSRVFDIFKGKSWVECNKPMQKNDVREQYKDDLIKGHYYLHTNYQLGDSKIAKSFEVLLESDWNTKGWKSVVGIYNSLQNGK